MAAPRVANPPERPLGIFDGDCGFCRQWVERWRARTGPRVDYAPSQEVAERFPEIPPEAFARAFQLVLPDGRVLEGAAAVLATLELAPGGGALSALARIPVLGALLELAYRLVASHRPSATFLTRLLWGRSVEKPTYFGSERALSPRPRSLLSRRVRLALGPGGRARRRSRHPAGRSVSRLGAFADRDGAVLAPADALLVLVERRVPARAVRRRRVRRAPARRRASRPRRRPRWPGFSISRSRSPGRCSCSSSGTTCCSRPGSSRSSWRRRGAGEYGRGLAASPVVLFLLRWLLFRLMFSSGWVKLASGDPTWRNLSALRFHYETQPLPPWTAWFLHQCPPWFQTVSALFLFFVELVVPFLYFAPRRLRLFAFRADGAAAAADRRDRATTGSSTCWRWRSPCCSSTTSPCRGAGGARPRPRPARPRAWPKAVLVPVACVGDLRFVRRVRRHARPLARAAADGGRRRAAARRLSQLQHLRPLHGDDDRASGDPDRRQQRRRRLATVRVPVEAGRRLGAPALRRAAPAASGLADVVRRARVDRGESLARPVPRAAARGIARGRRAARRESLPGPSAALRARDDVRLPVHGLPPSAAAPAPGGGAR